MGIAFPVWVASSVKSSVDSSTLPDRLLSDAGLLLLGVVIGAVVGAIATLGSKWLDVRHQYKLKLLDVKREDKRELQTLYSELACLLPVYFAKRKTWSRFEIQRVRRNELINWERFELCNPDSYHAELKEIEGQVFGLLCKLRIIEPVVKTANLLTELHALFSYDIEDIHSYAAAEEADLFLERQKDIENKISSVIVAAQENK